MILTICRAVSAVTGALKLKLLPGAVCSVAILFAVVAQTELRVPCRTGPNPAAAAAATMSRVAARQEPPQISPVCITVDATKHASDDSAALHSICARLQQASGVKPVGITSTVQAPDPPVFQPSTPDWYLWAQLESHCSALSAPAPGSVANGSTGGVQVYAVHSDSGGTVCLSNSTAVASSYILKLKLPRGVFRLEKLAFVPQATPGTTPSADTLKAGSPGNGACHSALRRLEGADIADTTTLTKAGDLAAGEVIVLRYTDVARAARSAIIDLKSQLHDLATSTPGPAHRLQRIVGEGDKYISGVTAGGTSTSLKRLGCIHRLILLMSQAESLHRNYQSRQSVNANPGARTMGALERIEDSLAETSAVITGLVPQIELGPFTPSSPTGNADAAAQSVMMEAVVTVSVRNTGSRSVDSVKLGLDASALPQGAVCIPDDPAFFGTLRPGQAVRASFRLRMPANQSEGEDAAPARCVADVSYFTAGAPAHLRPRPW